MQTFLPYRDFAECAACLDNKRLGKQRVEAKQILIALGVGVGQHEGTPTSRWRSHPAVKMWRGYERALAKYSIEICHEWRRRGFKDSLLPQFRSLMARINFGTEVLPIWERPRWFNSSELYSSHRSNLLRKLPEHYSAFGWTEDDSMPYFWPTENGF